MAVCWSRKMKISYSASFLICVSYISRWVEGMLLPNPDFATSNYYLAELLTITLIQCPVVYKGIHNGLVRVT